MKLSVVFVILLAVAGVICIGVAVMVAIWSYIVRKLGADVDYP